MNFALGHKTQNTKSFVCFSMYVFSSASPLPRKWGNGAVGEWASGPREGDEPIEMPKRVCMALLALHMGDTEVQSSLLSSASSSPEC